MVARCYKPLPTPDRSLLPDLAYRERRSKNQDRRRERINMLEEQSETDVNWEEIIETSFLSKDLDPKFTQKPKDKPKTPPPPV